MKCFNHAGVDAVALCKACGRALCRECVAEVGRSCSCRNRCEADVAALDDLAVRGRTAYQKTSATYFRSGIFMSLFGAVFLFLGLASSRGNGPSEFNYFMILMGLVFGGWAISQFVSARRLRQK